MKFVFDIGKRIVSLREASNLSQRLLSEFLEKSRGYVTQLETGNTKLTVETEVQLAKIFNISKEYFQVHEHSLQLETILEMFFTDLLLGNLEKIPKLLKKPYPSISVEQEVALKLLGATYYYKKRKPEKSLQLQTHFLNLFFEKQKLDTFPPYIQKYYHLFSYEKKFYEKNLLTCLAHLQKLNPFLTTNLEKGALLLKTGNISYHLQNYGDARRDIEKAMAILVHYEIPHLLGNGYMLNAALYSQLKLFDEAKEELNKLALLAENPTLTEFASIASQHKGFIYSQKKQFSKALEEYKKAFDLAEKENVKIKILISLIHTQIELQDLNDAKKLIANAREIAIQEFDLMILFSYECQIHLYEGRKKEHTQLLKKVLIYFESNHFIEDLYYIYGYLANYYGQKKSFSEAVKYYQKREALQYECA